MAMKPDDSGVLESAKTVDCEISACAVSAADAIREALDKAQRPVIMLGHGVSDKAVRDQLFTLARQWENTSDHKRVGNVSTTVGRSAEFWMHRRRLRTSLCQYDRQCEK